MICKEGNEKLFSPHVTSLVIIPALAPIRSERNYNEFWRNDREEILKPIKYSYMMDGNKAGVHVQQLSQSNLHAQPNTCTVPILNLLTVWCRG